MLSSHSLLGQLRLSYKPELPRSLTAAADLIAEEEPYKNSISADVKADFPYTYKKGGVYFTEKKSLLEHPLRVGVLFSGGQAPGGHNVIAGLFDYLQSLDPRCQLIGFLDGASGLLQAAYIPLTGAVIDLYRNQGGFDLLGSGRTKIESPAQFEVATQNMTQLQLNGLVIIGGDDSNTNAALLAEYLAARSIDISIVGVPKTIDGDLKNDKIAISFGFDTASKVYANLIGNISRDALSAKKYYHFIKLMGRTASHLALECALKTHPNYLLIGEELAAKSKTLEQITRELADLISQRAAVGKEYGVVLIPEGILEFIPDCKALISELNQSLATGKIDSTHLAQLSSNEERLAYVCSKISDKARKTLQMLPHAIQSQLLIDRDAHGNVQISKIDTDRLLIDLVIQELKKRAAEGSYKGKFNAQPHFLGYEGRSCLPSNFDAQYCYALGYVGGILIRNRCNGYLATIKEVARPVAEWIPAGAPLTSMISFENRSGTSKAVIAKALVDLQGAPFKSFNEQRQQWAVNDQYSYPGPIQFFGPPELTEAISLTLQLEEKTSSLTLRPKGP